MRRARPLPVDADVAQPGAGAGALGMNRYLRAWSLRMPPVTPLFAMECEGDGDSSVPRCGGVSRETPPIAPITSDGRSTARSGRDRGTPPDLGSESACIRHTESRMSSSLSTSGREKSTDGGSSMSAGHLVLGAIRHNRLLSKKRRELRPYLHSPRATLLRSIALKHGRSPRPVSRQVRAAGTRPHYSTYACGVLLTSC